MVLNDSGQCHPLMTGGRVVKRTTSWCFANGQETGTIGVPAVPLPLLFLLLLLLLLFLLILLLLLLVYRPSCANSIRRHCCWLVLLLIYCLLATRAPQVVQCTGCRIKSIPIWKIFTETNRWRKCVFLWNPPHHVVVFPQAPSGSWVLLVTLLWH